MTTIFQIVLSWLSKRIEKIKITSLSIHLAHKTMEKIKKWYNIITVIGGIFMGTRTKEQSNKQSRSKGNKVQSNYNLEHITSIRAKDYKKSKRDDGRMSTTIEPKNK